MLIVKFIVLVCLFFVCACEIDYCKICDNHTLCKYKIQGPSPECHSYDKTASLTRYEITEVVHKINDRRNFVAMGYSRILPEAANMRKISWSSELAVSAQRWADQCDRNIRPDKEDECRDLENIKVGQNIASVTGPTYGLTVKSFVETWFMQVLEYSGSVMYYNQSRDYKTNYLTQLIWAETEAVGCGRAKFYAKERNIMLERIVCNFAPKGNIHGKPVYAVGFASTQCPQNMAPDTKFKGLCANREQVRKLQTERPSVSSLLRILNLSNNSVKYEIDPIRTDFKQINFNTNNSLETRNQKTRHVHTNNTMVGMKRVQPLRKQNLWKSFMNNSRNDYEYLYSHERGHSRVYHGHEVPRFNYASSTEPSTHQDFRKYDYIPIQHPSKDYRKYYNRNQKCTRHINPIINNYPTSQCGDNHCTRGTQGCQHTTTCQSTFREIPFTNPPLSILPHDMCPCSERTCEPTTTNCNCNTNCQCPHAPCSTKTDCFTTLCPKIHRMQEDVKDDTRKFGTFQYYDMIPNVVVRSGNENTKDENSSPKETSFVYDDTRNKRPVDRTQVKDVIDHLKYDDQDHDYLYRTFLDSSIRKRRQPNYDIAVRPFWQIDENGNKNLPQIKSLRYTTLANRKRKSRKTKETLNFLKSTEPITIKIESTHDVKTGNKLPGTEKYMSFEELMHLRKFSDRIEDDNARRQGNLAPGQNEKQTEETATTISVSTTETPTIPSPTTLETSYLRDGKATTKKTTTTTTTTTTITPFPRIKHCTRKLTCTWTEVAVTGLHGKVIAGGVNDGGGTLPGFQSGCSRTSTCTREYKDRNKQSTLPDIGSGVDPDQIPEDEEYCERRSLNIKRRNSEGNEDTFFSGDEAVEEDIHTTTSYFLENYESASQSYEEVTFPSNIEENSRPKRQHIIELSKNAVTENSFVKHELYGHIHDLGIQNMRTRIYSKKCCSQKFCSCNRAEREKISRLLYVIAPVLITLPCVFYL